jgi:hypothetical protein
MLAENNPVRTFRKLRYRARRRYRYERKRKGRRKREPIAQEMTKLALSTLTFVPYPYLVWWHSDFCQSDLRYSFVALTSANLECSFVEI